MITKTSEGQDIDSTTYRLSVWEKEYMQRKHLPSTNNTEFPSRALVSFLEKFNPTKRNLALDFGSGNGRNSFYLTQQAGYKKVIGVEFVKYAIDFAIERAQTRGLQDHVSFLHQSLGETIPLPDGCANLIIDMFTMHSLTEHDRSKMISEVKRLLNTKGYFVFSTMGVEGEAVKSNIAKFPGPEANSYRFKVEDSIVTEKAFYKDELVDLLKPLKLVEIEAVEQETVFNAESYKHIYYSGVFQKI